MILCIDPTAKELEETREALEARGFRTRGAGSVSDGRAELETADSVECLVTEQELDDGTGLELIRETREIAPDAACVLYTDAGLGEIDTAAFGDVVAEYVPKDDPAATDRLVDVVEHSLAFRSQTAYPLPDDEDARLAALERYTDDPEALSASLDRLTELAVAQFDVESAAVGLIDSHEERFLSCFGASFEPLDREETICTYAILEEDVTVVEDASADPRFSDNETLAGANIRFYAGAPLRAPTGQAIGTFCLQDDEPGTFSDRDRELLTLFAEETMDQLELRRQLREGEDDD